ncbi:MAG: hypothetical protein K2X25_11565 [Caulobacteraceae bacterium]|nr:hypothetical protein [Caulobacteraceae bacterium]
MSKVQQSPDAPAGRSAIIVAGMHRSGTSAMARVLGLAGASLPERLIQPGDDNPKGFWEPQEVVALNDEILRTLGSTWNDVFGFRVAGLARDQHDHFIRRAQSVLALNFAGEGQVVMKDPRVSLLAPVWREALVAEGFKPAFLIMVRHPLEVARSIAARDGAPLQASTLAWLSHVIAVERDTRDLPRIFVRYSDLLANWRPVLDRIGRHLDLDLDPGAGTAIDAYLTRSERHHAADDEDLASLADLWPGVGEAWRWLINAAKPEGPVTPFPAQIEEDLIVLQSRIGPVLDLQRREAERRQAELQRALADRQTQLLRRGAQATEYQNAQLRLEADLAAAREDAAALRDRIEAETTAHAEAVRRLEEARHRSEDIARQLDAAQHQVATADLAFEAQQEQLMATVAAADRERSEAAEFARTETGRAERAEQAVRSLEARMEAMRLSPSWTLTRPLRVVRKRLSGLSGQG